MPIKIAYSSKKVKRRWFPPLDREIVMKKIYFPKNMVRADVFLQVLWQFLSVWLRRLSEFSRGAFLSTCGGEIRSNYFKYSAPIRKSQILAVRSAPLGHQTVRLFGLKTELAVFGGKRKFFHILISQTKLCAM